MVGEALARVAVLLSGRGSNFLSLHAAMERGEIPARVVVVVSNKSKAAGLAKAVELGIPAITIPRQRSTSQQHDQRVLEVLRQHSVEWVCLAGYMRLLSPSFVAAFPRRILNIHPSLLPSFPGLEAQRQALQHGVRVSGCTVHLVDEGLDSGPVVVQKAVAIEDDDTESSLAARILDQEHRAYPEALHRLLTQEWAVEGRRIQWRGGYVGRVSGP